MTADDTQLLIERSFYEALRLELVAKGLTPDIATYDDTPTGYEEYQTDLAAIKTATGHVVELFGTGNAQNRGLIDTSRIVIDSITYVPGHYGLDTSKQIKETTEPFTETVSHNLSFRYFIDVILSTDLKLVERKMVKAIHSALSLRGMLKHYNSEETFFIEMLAAKDETLRQEGLMRKRFSFEIPDVIFYQDTIISSVAKMTEYEFNINIQNYLGIN